MLLTDQHISACLLHQTLQQFREQSCFLDVILRVDDNDIPAHSSLLATYSTTCLSLLRHATPFYNDKHQIVISLDAHDIDFECLMTIVNFIYHGSVDISSCEAQKLFHDATFLGVRNLITLLEDYKNDNPLLFLDNDIIVEEVSQLDEVFQDENLINEAVKKHTEYEVNLRPRRINQSKRSLKSNLTKRNSKKQLIDKKISVVTRRNQQRNKSAITSNKKNSLNQSSNIDIKQEKQDFSAKETTHDCIENKRLGEQEQAVDHTDSESQVKSSSLEQDPNESDSKGNIYQCEESDCTATFSNKKALKKHLVQVHIDLSCKECPLVAKSRSQLITHEKSHLPKSLRKHTLCEDCGEAVLPCSLRMHQLKHSTHRHSCPHCPYSTVYERYLTSHIARRHSPAAPRPFQCAECSFSGFTATELKNHERKHKPDKRLKCTECSYTATSTGLITMHMRTHTQERPYPCKLCSKSFKQGTHLLRHMRWHQGVKPHVCNICSEGFLEKRMLETHQFLMHLGIKPYICNYCDYDCVKPETLKSHMKKFHGLSSPKLTDNNKRNIQEFEGSMESKAQLISDDSNFQTLRLALEQQSEIMPLFKTKPIIEERCTEGVIEMEIYTTEDQNEEGQSCIIPVQDLSQFQ